MVSLAWAKDGQGWRAEPVWSHSASQVTDATKGVVKEPLSGPYKIINGTLMIFGFVLASPMPLDATTYCKRVRTKPDFNPITDPRSTTPIHTN